MKNIEILLQGEHIPDIELVELVRGKKVRDLIATAASHRKEEAEGEFYAFAEDADEALAPDDDVPCGEDRHPVRLHVHRCGRIEVMVTYNGVNKEHIFGPGTSIATVKKWAAINAFGMDPGDAAEHVLQIKGTTNRTEPDTHIGALVVHPNCSVAFDLVPLKRVEG